MAEGLSTEVKTVAPKKRFFLIAVLIFLAFLLLGVFLLKPKLPFKTYRQAEKQPQLVTNFPQLPIYPQAVLLSSSIEGEGEKIKYSGSWETKDTVPEVGAWYSETLKNSGWLLDLLPADPQENKIQLWVAQKGETKLHLSLERQDDASSTLITAEFPPKIVEDKN